ncbi:hypothetical protein MFIFM68171_01936 [Madurella fahalii]|uniref:WSC domain-containing protein n=1 Tax=Madurella fahalii TaxID=1157608 RepID=A0ABQ0G1V0_9PEZI
MRIRASQVLLAAASLLSCADAQAFFGSVQAELEACGSDNFVYLGCFDEFEANAGEFFNFRPQAFITSLSDPSSTFPGWDPGSLFNNTVTPLSCARACRGFGYKFTSLRDNVCECGTQMPLGYTADVAAVCDAACFGDSAQTCGGSTDAQVYLDPTFADNAEITPDSDPVVAEFYRYVGCYYAPTGFPTADSRALALVTSIDDCFAACAGMGYPLVYGVPESGEVRCHCGTTFGYPSHRVYTDLLATPGDCNIGCEAGAVPGDCDIATERCCGQNDVFPVYINTELQGCYTPLLPGFKESINDPTYDCNDLSDLLTGPPTELSLPDFDPADLIDSDPALIHRVMVSANGRTYYLNGCYGLAPLGDAPENGVFNVVGSTPILGLTPATLVECANQCSTLNYDAFGMVNGQDCYCATSVFTNADPEAMSTCRVACVDADNIACGGATSPIVYTVDVGGIFPDLAARLAIPPPDYECERRVTITTTRTITSTTSTTTTDSTTTSTTTTDISTTSTTTSTTTTDVSTSSTTTTDVSTTSTTTSTTTTDVSTTSTTTSTTTTDVSTTSTTTTDVSTTSTTTSTTTTDVSTTSTTTSTTTTDISTTSTTTTGTSTTSTSTTSTITLYRLTRTTSTTTTTTSTTSTISLFRLTRTTSTSRTTTTTTSTRTRTTTTTTTTSRTRTWFPWPTWNPWCDFGEPGCDSFGGNEPFTGGGFGPGSTTNVQRDTVSAGDGEGEGEGTAEVEEEIVQVNTFVYRGADDDTDTDANAQPLNLNAARLPADANFPADGGEEGLCSGIGCTLDLPDNLFHLPATAPPDMACSTVVESWLAGATTVLGHAEEEGEALARGGEFVGLAKRNRIQVEVEEIEIVQIERRPH